MQTLHVISHTHWDREWYLTFQQFRLKLVHLIDKLLDILAEDPNFRYFMLDGQTIVLDDYLQMRPEMEEVLRKYIQRRAHPDRSLAYPARYVPGQPRSAHPQSAGRGPHGPHVWSQNADWVHSRSLRSPRTDPANSEGVWHRSRCPVARLSDLPAELWWQSPDGSRVLLAYLRDSYSNGANLPVHDPMQFTQLIAIARDSLAAHSAVNDFLIMLGTDHMEPSPHTSAAIAYANANLPNTQVIHSTLPDYVQTISNPITRLEKTIPTIRGELRACDRSNLLPGVLSTRMWIKQRNHNCQTPAREMGRTFQRFFAEYDFK